MALRKIAESMPGLALAAAFAAAAPGLAVQPAAPEGPYWNVDHGELYCTLARYNGADQVNFGLRVIPGAGRTELVVTSRAWRRTPLHYGQSADIVLEPGGRRFPARAYTGRLRSRDRVVLLTGLDPAFVDSFAEAGRIRLVRGDEVVEEIAFPRPGAAVRTLRDCFDRTLGEWGVDVARRATLQSLPVAINIPFYDGDYPDAALRDNAQGVAVIRLTVGADGRVSDCAAVRSSGNRELDYRSCQNFRAMGRFRPAIGADGQPAEAGIVTTVTWRIAG